MKKIVVALSIFINSILIFAQIEAGGVVYYSEDEVKEKGIEVRGENLQAGENTLTFDEDSVCLNGYLVEFSKGRIVRGGKTYYNTYLVEALAGIYEPEEPREGIVSLSPGITEKVFALGLGENISGRTIYCVYPEEAKKVADVGSMLEPSFEKVMVRNPGIVLMEAHYNEGFVAQLKRVGVDYRIYETPKNLKEMYEHLIDLGRALGVEGRARILAASLESRAAEYMNRGRGHATNPTVYYALGTGRAEYTAGGDTFIGDLIVHSGGVNIAGDKKGWNYSLEELIAKDPEYIIGGRTDIDNLRSEKKYSLLRAVREGKLIEVDTDIYNLPGVRAVNVGIPIIYEAIYGEK
ncbi:hypothetical protein PM10SUCC1_25230 [Propionigenium maris DSM 9537]|uniref:Fe/B12 periplasmic-binding domain-containing protein n=1 Tax=Propionigenium maris DSM 9537 TaxID=1123000 RepID=A0A9W6GKX6_9FUSO|nr:ABC transporter substrate-binding protein [Propionigenium maris]GLI57009.1 hypothetical protein PM10SUCC1_25230 [Propionigenium maris DSM 9537]